MIRRREHEQISLSFLDCISCGLGAIILLLILAKTAEPMVMEQVRENKMGLVAELQEQLAEMRGETVVYNRELTTRTEQLSEIRDRIARMMQMLSMLRSEFDDSSTESAAIASLETQLKQARQELNEAQRAQRYVRARDDTTVGGIPVDSEYIIFIIDTSGSMQAVAWDLLLAKVEETLEVYPEVKGIQVMNDMGQYMFPRYAGKWIPDTPARRNAIITRLRTWNVFSNSSPVEGITRAIRTFWAADRKISLYVFGDDFQGGSVQRVVETVDRINRADDKGNRRVRIHTVGFPVQFLVGRNVPASGLRYASLMRILAERNGGTFIGLNTFKP